VTDATPELLVVGHVTHDLVGNEVRLGGTASYAAVVALRLGLCTAVLTSAAADYVVPPELAGVAVHSLPADQGTVFEHHWQGGFRDQFVRARAAVIDAAAVPAAFRATPIVLGGPVAGEVEAGLMREFPRALRGATLQGWLRRIADDGHVEPVDAAAWPFEPLLDALQIAFLSEEDLAADAAVKATVLRRWGQRVPILVVTRGERGSRIAVDGRWHTIAAVPAVEVDGTGAGDAFAAAFLIRYHETADAAEAARFAASTASFVVEAAGIAGAPDRAAVEERLRRYPEIRLVPEVTGEN